MHCATARVIPGLDQFVNIGTKLASEIENDSPEETLMDNHTPSVLHLSQHSHLPKYAQLKLSL